MRQLWKRMIVLFSMTVLLLPAAFAFDAGLYFPLQDGNSWTYSSSKDDELFTETTVIKGKEIIDGVETVKIYGDDGDYTCMAADSEGVKIYKDVMMDNFEIYKPPFLVIPNMSPGESRAYAVNSETYKGVGGQQQQQSMRGDDYYEVAIDLAGEMDVPAGRFSDCVKLSSIFKWKIGGGSFGNDTITTWLAPGVGEIKKVIVLEGFDASTQEEYSEIKISELHSAVIDGKVIGLTQGKKVE